MKVEFAEFLDGAIHSCSDRPKGYAIQLGDILVLHLLKSGKNQQLTARLGELHQSALEQHLFLILLVLPARCRDVVPGFCSAEFVQWDSAVLTKIVRAGVSRDLIHPRDEAVGFLIGISIFQNPNEYVMNEVLAGNAISGEAAEEIVEGIAVPLIQNLQLVEIAFPDGYHKGFISPLHVHHL